MSTLLNFTDADKEAVGLLSSSSTPAEWISWGSSIAALPFSYLTSPSTKGGASGNVASGVPTSTSVPGPSPESFSELWVKFLLREVNADPSGEGSSKIMIHLCRPHCQGHR